MEEEVVLLLLLWDAHLQLQQQFLIVNCGERLDLLLHRPGCLSNPHTSLIADVAGASLHRPVDSALCSGELRQLGRIFGKY